MKKSMEFSFDDKGIHLSYATERDTNGAYYVRFRELISEEDLLKLPAILDEKIREFLIDVKKINDSDQSGTDK